ncbi:hypothetical protein C7B82_24275 [Stenomitos frigidus ULC18]|uniref:Uncharacterized protein n=2 Tax=Stenomitos TaxID=1844270 RepID=A0A2T1DXC4_9CYAN|nr:hypothetical protein C7B82_24275 [Stenomitos frigidus ULC18]
MQTLSLIGQVDANGHLRLDVPTHLPPGDVELVLVINPVASTPARSQAYDFSDLAGRLQWQGDAIAMQRTIRDEW